MDESGSIPSTRWESRVNNPKGVHCRVAAQLAEIVASHDAEVRIINQGEPADCSSILDVLSLGLVQGSLVGFTAHGPEADKMPVEIKRLFSGLDAG